MEDRRASLPSNARTLPPGAAAQEQTAVEVIRDKVIEGTVIRRKKSFWGKLKDVGFNGMFRSAMDTAANILDFIEMIGDGIDMLRGEGRPRSSSRGRYAPPGPRVAQTPYYRMQDPRQQDTRREMSRVGRATHNFDEVEFETKEEAEVVLFNLWDDLRRYPYTTVQAFYQFAGERISLVDADWGWDNLDAVRAKPVRSGGERRWILDLPRPIYLKGQ